MAEGGSDSAVGEELSKFSKSSVKCGFCETSLSNLKTTFLCQTCQPNDNHHHLCQFCVVMHVRKSHHVTDHNGAPVEVCEKDKNVAMFLCKTCDLRMFCYACFEEHCAHNFAKLSECHVEMKQIVGRTHESLSRSDVIYKRTAKCADIAKTNEARFSGLCHFYNSDYFQRDLENILLEVLSAQQLTDTFVANTKTLGKMSEYVKILDDSVKEVGDSQMRLRSMLSSSMTRIFRYHSDGDLTNLEDKQNQPNVCSVPKFTDRDVENYQKNLDKKRAVLIKELRILVLDYVKTFLINKVESSYIDLHDLTGEFNRFKLPLECTEVKIAPTVFGLLLACRVGDQFSVYRVSDPANDAQFLKEVSVSDLWLFGTGKYECIRLEHYTMSNTLFKVHFFEGGFNELTDTIIVNHSQCLDYWPLQLVGFYSTSLPKLWPITAHNSDGEWSLLLDSFECRLKDEPYNFVNMVDDDTGVWHAFISGGYVFIKMRSSQTLKESKVKIPCCKSGDEHFGQFGCGFPKDCRRPELILLGMWCLQCKVLEIWRLDLNLSPESSVIVKKIERVLRFIVPVLDMKQVAFVGKKCFVVSANNTVQYCDDILQRQEFEAVTSRLHNTDNKVLSSPELL